MTETKKNTETKAASKTATKAKSTSKPKTAAKPKARSETKSKTNTADTAPNVKKDSKPESSHTQSAKQNSSAPMVLLLVSAILILATIYKFNDEHSNLPAQAEPTAKSAETTSAAMLRANPANNNADSQLVGAPYQNTPPAYEKTREQAMVQAQQRMTKRNKMMQQRRQAYEKEMQSRQQQYIATMKAHQQERAKIAEAQKAEFQRMKQSHLETKKKVQELQQQIFTLHEKIRQLIHELHAQHKP